MAGINAYLIDSSYIKTNYSMYIDSNIDDNLLNNAILFAQNVNLQEALGYTMYYFIVNKLISDPTGAGLSTQYLYLLENYIQPYIALYAVYNAYPNLWVKATNKSIVMKKGDDSESININVFNMIRGEIKNNAMFYQSRIIEYISNYPGDFQEYYTTNGVNRIYPSNSAYKAGVYMTPAIGMRGNLQDVRLPGKGTDLSW